MAAESKPTPVDRPLWVIAIALLFMALCLLVLVVHTLVQETPQATQQPPASPRSLSPSVESLHRPHPRETFLAKTTPRTAVGQDLKAAELTNGLLPALEELPVAPSAKASAQPIGGYAPLSSLGQTNYHTAIVGRITLHGKPPPEQVLELGQTSNCGSGNSGPPTTRHFVVGPGGTLADVLVFIRDGLPKWHQLPAPAADTLQFTNCQIQPYMSALAWRQSLRAESDDGLRHELQVAPLRGRELVAQVDPGSAASVVLPPTPQLLIACTCRLHPWESAFVSTFDHPFFAVTGSEGMFIITNVPPGKYVVEACHQRTHGTNGIARPVTVKLGEVVHADFVVESKGT